MTPRLNDSDLPLLNGTRVYHLNVSADEIAPNIIIVGDPDRVSLIAHEHLAEIEVEQFHRGLRTITGIEKSSGMRLTITTSGMGTPSLEICLNELVALNEYDLNSKSRISPRNPLKIIRVGTSGALQGETELGTLIVSHFAIGLDGTGLFYDVPITNQHVFEIELSVRSILEEMHSGDRFPSPPVYVSQADSNLVRALELSAKKFNVAYKGGITASCAGFFANQGRDISRITPTVNDIDRILAQIEFPELGLKIENMEMESSFLFHFMGGLGYQSASICPVIANRELNTFSQQMQQNIKDATRVAIEALICANSSPITNQTTN